MNINHKMKRRGAKLMEKKEDGSGEKGLTPKTYYQS